MFITFIGVDNNCLLTVIVLRIHTVFHIFISSVCVYSDICCVITFDMRVVYILNSEAVLHFCNAINFT